MEYHPIETFIYGRVYKLIPYPLKITLFTIAWYQRHHPSLPHALLNKVVPSRDSHVTPAAYSKITLSFGPVLCSVSLNHWLTHSLTHVTLRMSRHHNQKKMSQSLQSFTPFVHILALPSSSSSTLTLALFFWLSSCSSSHWYWSFVLYPTKSSV